MTVFADASALISLIAGEADADDIADRLARYDKRLCSALSLWETVAALRASHGASVMHARAAVRSFRVETKLEVVPIGEIEFQIAADAYAAFGKGRHPAALNMGDCFAYACAKFHGARLLFKGSDFGKTDIGSA